MASFNWLDIRPIVVLIAYMVIPIFGASDVSDTFWYSYCLKANFSPDSQYKSNLNTLMVSLSSNAASNPSGFYSRSISSGTNDAVYGLFLCRGDINISSCSDCINTATLELPQKYCPNREEGVIWYASCMVRYSNESFFAQMEELPSIYFFNTQNVSPSLNTTKFMEILGDLLANVSSQAAAGGSDEKFSTGSYPYTDFIILYALAQCTPDLTETDCRRCLADAYSRMISIISSSMGGRVLTPSCIVRYETYPFFNGVDATPAGGISSICTSALSPTTCNECLGKAMEKLPSSNNGRISLPGCTVQYNNPVENGIPTLSPLPPEPQVSSNKTGRSRKKKLLAILASISISLLFVVFLAFCMWVRTQKSHSRKVPKFDPEEIKTVESMQFHLHTIRAATQNFSRDNKLGEGGFGEVYKGILESGQEIAVKRLSKSSGQGDIEFKTEVLLVAKLQHKNLVKLFGYCFDSKEKILIYEYLQNSSLDKILFDSTKNSYLDWPMRFKIIDGIAKGLMYLHEGSRLKIIHRDLKPSNILLDNSMAPKISDFGMARLFGVDETQGDTKRIVGTYGYMAPEYAMTGHFSVKSDVYSFGVIVLEIVSGQKNRFFGRPNLEEALMHRAWRLWNEKKALDLVDATLGESFPKEEVTKCIHLGLLCIQENVDERPKMTTVVAALNGHSISLPVPKAPNFFGNRRASNEVASVNYKSPLCGREIEYHQSLHNQSSPCVYSGAEEITELNPR